MSCVWCLRAGDKVCHFWKSVNHNKYRICTTLSSRKTQDKIHGQVFPRWFHSGTGSEKYRPVFWDWPLATWHTGHFRTSFPTSLFSWGQYYLSSTSARVLSLPTCPPNPPPWRSLIIFSLKELFGIHNLLPLNKYPSCMCRISAEDSLGICSMQFYAYKSFRHSKPTTFVCKIVNSAARRLRTSATLFMWPDLCFNTNVNRCR